MKIFNFIFLKVIRIFNKIFRTTFSFSADGEDVILRKYLSGIQGGHFIDIGSHYPVEGSNTYGFYLVGWNGICIDPLPKLKTKYQIFRNRDIFINSGVSIDSSSEKEFYFYKDFPDNSTYSYERVLELEKIYQRKPSEIITSSILSIKDLLNNFPYQDVHLLNIDIEGMEIDILKEVFRNKFYPWVICIEEIGKTSETVLQGDIYDLTKANGYIFASRTFLSSIYVKLDKIELMPSPYLDELNVN